MRQWLGSTHLSLCLQTCNTADLNLPELLPAFEGSAQHFLQSAVSSAQQQAPGFASGRKFHPFLTKFAGEDVKNQSAMHSQILGSIEAK